MRGQKTILFILIISLLTVLPGIAPSLFSHEPDDRYGHIHIRGRLTTPDGNPIAGARVLWREGAGSLLEGGRIRPTFHPEGSSVGSPPSPPPGGSPISGLDKTCLHRPPSPGGVRTEADGRYELIFLIKNDEACIRSISTLRGQNVNVYLEKEGYGIRRKPGISPLPVGAPVPGR